MVRLYRHHRYSAILSTKKRGLAMVNAIIFFLIAAIGSAEAQAFINSSIISQGKLKIECFGKYDRSPDGLLTRLVIATALSELRQQTDFDFSPILSANWTFYNTADDDPDEEENKNIAVIVDAMNNTNIGLIIGLEKSCFNEARITCLLPKLTMSPTCQDARIISKPYNFRTFVRLGYSAIDYANTLRTILKTYNWTSLVLLKPESPNAEDRDKITTISTVLRASGVSIIEKEYTGEWLLTKPLNASKCYSGKIITANCSRNTLHIALRDTLFLTRIYLLVSLAVEDIELLALLMERMGLTQTNEFFVLALARERPFELWSNAKTATATKDMLLSTRPGSAKLLRSLGNMSLWLRSSFMFSRPQRLPSSPGKSADILAAAAALAKTQKVTIGQNFSATGNDSTGTTPNCPPVCNNFSAFREANITAAFDENKHLALYDVIMVYAEAFKRQALLNKDPMNGLEMAKLIVNRTYGSGFGKTFHIDVNGTTHGTILIYYVNQVASVSYTVSIAAYGIFGPCDCTTITWSNATWPGVANSWIGKKAPVLGMPKCGFDGRLCRTQAVEPWKWIAIVAGVFVTLLCAFILSVFLRHWRHLRELERQLWKIEPGEIVVQRSRNDPGSIIASIMNSPVASQLSHSEASLQMAKSHLALRDYEANVMRRVKHELAIDRGVRARRRAAGKDPNDPIEQLARVDRFSLGLLKGNVVALKRIPKKQVEFTRSIREELKLMRDLKNENLCPFLGAIYQPPHVILVLEYCPRGCLKDILESEIIQLDNMFLSSIVFDIIKGMQFIHNSALMFHGRLKSTNTLVDSAWSVKLSGFGLREFRAEHDGRVATLDEEETTFIQGNTTWRYLWTAPEILRDTTPGPRGTRKGDVYSFGIMLHEIFGRRGVFGGEFDNIHTTIRMITSPVDGAPFTRPPLDVVSDAPAYAVTTMVQCWSEEPNKRPSFREIKRSLGQLREGLLENIVDNMFAMMEKYAKNLEDLVADRTKQLAEERRKCEKLLLMMLPKSVAEQLKRGQHVEAETYENVSIYFSDLVGFTDLSAESTPMEIVAFLNDVYTCFDSIIGNFDVYKVETIGDAYMVVSGLPLRNGDNHAGEVASMSLELIEEARKFKIKHRPNDSLNLRVGIHSGTCVAGVVGLVMPRYCLFGDAVNTASRLQSNGKALKIHCSSECKNLLETLGGYALQERGFVELKGKGQLLTFWLVSQNVEHRMLRIEQQQSKYPSLKIKQTSVKADPTGQQIQTANEPTTSTAPSAVTG